MSETLSNITTIIAIASLIITVIFAIQTIKESRQKDRDAQTISDNSKFQSDEYSRILAATKELESNREKNKGQHFEDEVVYLNRANQIRINSPFFSWVR